ncbi:hypothetical protein [Micromonospora siamensis]|uniref:Uncharacterized protein n=1 Tax=Micromonospora siamensis TaxID=299152 RepID=A0A1C5H211_9ACTN|nr:hypothetical protein [Micromonospora siamensis]SCG40038.1 hypothetical protein GA0074704_0912 [Micromonospora siamensis]
MDDAYVSGDPDGLTPLLRHIRDAVARELHAQLALRAERIDLADVPEVAYQVTRRVDEVLTGLTPRRTSAGR